MLLNTANLKSLFGGFNTSFQKGFSGAKPAYNAVAMVVPSSSKELTYAWLAQLPKVREWLGDRIVKNLSLHGYTITNRLFESTVSVKAVDVEDDQYGVLAPVFTEMGKSAAEHPDDLVFGLMKDGFTTPCYDGQYFFDSDHPVKDADGNLTSASNVQAGAGTPWYLLDCSRAIKPMVFQDRVAPRLQALNQDSDDHVFKTDEFLYGTRSRSNAGFGLWQLAYASKADLTPDNYETARQTMMARLGDEGRPLGVVPDTIVVPSTLEGAAMRVVNNGSRIVTVGDQSVAINNEWANTAKLIVTPWLA